MNIAQTLAKTGSQAIVCGIACRDKEAVCEFWEPTTSFGVGQHLVVELWNAGAEAVLDKLAYLYSPLSGNRLRI